MRFSGIYSVEFAHPTLVYSQYKLRIEDSGVVKALEYRYPGSERLQVEYPLRVQVQTRAVYFVEPPKPNLLAMLMNPQVLIMVAMMGMTFCLSGTMKQLSTLTTMPSFRIEAFINKAGLAWSDRPRVSDARRSSCWLEPDPHLNCVPVWLSSSGAARRDEATVPRHGYQQPG